MPTKNMIMKVKQGSSYVDVHPQTNASQIVDFVDAMQSALPVSLFATNKAHVVGDNVHMASLPSHMYLECTKAGTTGTTVPTISNPQVGDTIISGDTEWKIRSKNIFTEDGKIDISNFASVNPDGTINDNADFSMFVAQAPSHYSSSSRFLPGDSTTVAGRLSIIPPDNLWLNINGTGYKITDHENLVLSDLTCWDCYAVARESNKEYKVGDCVLGSNTNYIYTCTTAGTTTTGTPTWSTTVGANVTDGSVVWTVMMNPTVAANRAGKDFYIYAVASTEGPKLLLSASSTVPVGYNANNSRKVGGFHGLCLAVGTIANHPLTGYLTGDVLPLSVWSYDFKPSCEPEGMVYVEGLNIWVDIYLCSWDSVNSKFVSKFNGVIEDGATTRRWSYIMFTEQWGKQGKREPFVNEFRVFAKGSNEQTNIRGSADPNTTGGHYDTANRRMISNYGLEDCCGCLWQTAYDEYEYWPGATTSGSNTYFTGYSWSTLAIGTGYGFAYGLPRRAMVGSDFNDSSLAGSRMVYCSIFPHNTYSVDKISSRGVASHVVL